MERTPFLLFMVVFRSFFQGFTPKTGFPRKGIGTLLRIPTRKPQTRPTITPSYEIVICRGFTSSAFGTITSSTPFSKRALIASASTAVGNEKFRKKRP